MLAVDLFFLKDSRFFSFDATLDDPVEDIYVFELISINLLLSRTVLASRLNSVFFLDSIIIKFGINNL